MTTALTAGEVAGLIKPATTKCRLQLDADIVSRIEELEAQFEKELVLDNELNRAPVAPGLAERIVAMRREAEERETEFVFKSVGRLAFSNLLLKYQDSDGDQLMGADFPVNIEALVPELLAVACVSPEGTDVSWWKHFYDTVSWGQAQTLVLAAIAAQVGTVETPKAQKASRYLELYSENSD